MNEFDEMYKQNRWISEEKFGTESLSGEGSSCQATKNYLSTLFYVIQKYNIKNILDLGCGDFVTLNGVIQDINYLGVDGSKKIIELNEKRYLCKNIDFITFDIRNYAIINSYDLIICRDVLVHLPYKDCINIINEIKNSKSKYLLSTTFDNYLNEKDIEFLEWHKIALNKEPFNLGEPIEIEKENELNEEYKDKRLGLWKI